MKTINLEISGPLPAFEDAREIAIKKAENVIEDSVPIAWHEKAPAVFFLTCHAVLKTTNHPGLCTPGQEALASGWK